MEFDASIDLTTEIVPADLPWQHAVDRARAAVERLPGAFWISVEWCGGLPAGLPRPEWVRVYCRGQGGVMEGQPWDEIRADIKATVTTVLSAHH